MRSGRTSTPMIRSRQWTLSKPKGLRTFSRTRSTERPKDFAISFSVAPLSFISMASLTQSAFLPAGIADPPSLFVPAYLRTPVLRDGLNLDCIQRMDSLDCFLYRGLKRGELFLQECRGVCPEVMGSIHFLAGVE